MKLTAKDAWQIATDAAEIKAFREKVDAEVEKTAKDGGKYCIAYISWKVSQAAIEALAQEYREGGFEVGYDDDEFAKSEEQYKRGFWLEWKNVGR